MFVNPLSELNQVTETWKPDSNSALDRDLCRLFTLDTVSSQGSWNPCIGDNSNSALFLISCKTFCCPLKGTYWSEKNRSAIISFVHVFLGHIVLLLTIGQDNGSVHYLDNGGRLHRMADSFTTYMRLMMLYLGLPDWPLVHLNKEYNHWTQVPLKCQYSQIGEIKYNMNTHLN